MSQFDMFALPLRPTPPPPAARATRPAATAEGVLPRHSGETLRHPLIHALDGLTEIARLNKRTGPVVLGPVGWEQMLDVLARPPASPHRSPIEALLIGAMEHLIAQCNVDAEGRPTVTLPAWQAARTCLKGVCDAIRAGTGQAVPEPKLPEPAKGKSK